MILVPDYLGRVVNALIFAARAARSSPGAPCEIRVTEINRICEDSKHYDRIDDVLKAINSNAYFNALNAYLLDQRVVVGLIASRIDTREEIKEAYGTNKDAGRSVEANDEGARMQIIVDEKIPRVKKDLVETGNPARVLAIESGKRGSVYVVRDGLIEALPQALKNADDQNLSATNSVTALREWRREHNGDANQLEKLGVGPGGSVDIFFCRTSIEDTVHMLADGDVPVAPFDQLARVVTYQRETADEDRQPTTIMIYDNGRQRKRNNFSTRTAHLDKRGLKKLIGILLDAWMIGADVRVLATMPVQYQGIDKWSNLSWAWLVRQSLWRHLASRSENF